MINETAGSARVGIVGLGAVGSAFEHAMSFFYPCAGYDIKGKGSWNQILKTLVVFICVQTPEGLDGRLDCSAVDDVLLRLTESQYQGICVVKSTVRVGYMNRAKTRFPLLRLVYMPEFLREKSNFQWSVNPDRIVISGDETAVDEVLQLFSWVDGLDETVPVLRMSFLDAEIGKLAHNAYIANKVSFTNEIEKISHEHGADPSSVMSVIHADRRVKSREHLSPGLGAYGGKCVPKDIRELINASHNTVLLRAVESVNENIQNSRLVGKRVSAVAQSVENKSQ
jgi:UDPglucose 6-dehydrogenase